MANRTALFPKSDLDRIARSMQEAGIANWEILRKPTGEVSIKVSNSESNTASNSWDDA